MHVSTRRPYIHGSFQWPRMSDSMKRVLAFLCRMTVFVLLSVLSTMAGQEYTLTLYGRVLVSTMQVLIFCLVIAVLEVCIWIIRGMSSVGLYRTVEEQRAEIDMNTVDIEITDSNDDTLPAPPSEIGDETASRVSNGTNRIVFRGSKQLREHVWWVYYLGVLMFCTIYCLDFTLLSASFFFSLGVLFGWLVHSCYRFHESTTSKLLRFMYFLFLTLLVSFYIFSHKQILDSNTAFASRDAVIAVVMPFLTGVGWMYMPHEELVATIQTSFFTCCLLCLPVLVIVDTDQFQTIFKSAPPLIIVYLLAIEPLLKAMAVFTIALSLQTQRRLDLLIVLFVVVHIDDLVFHTMPHALMACTITAMVFLCVMHAVCLVMVGRA